MGLKIINVYKDDLDGQSKHYVAKVRFENKYYVLKLFSDKENGEKELENIKFYKQFVDNIEKVYFKPVEVFQYGDKNLGISLPYQFFILMEDLESSGYRQIVFGDLSFDEIKNIYTKYRKEWDIFGKQFDIDISFEKWKIQQVSLVNKQLDNGKNVIKSVIGDDFLLEKVRNLFKNLLDSLEEKDISFIFSFKHFREPHIWRKGNEFKLIDFEKIGYSTLAAELFGLVRADCLLNVDRFSNFIDFYDKFFKWLSFVELYIKNKTYLRFSLLVKLIGTIWQDFGYLLYRRYGRITPSIKRGILFNKKLIEKIFIF